MKRVRDDVVVLGAGHNGLVCACYLAMAGLQVRILERRNIVGGACVTEEFYPVLATPQRAIQSACLIVKSFVISSCWNTVCESCRDR